MRILIIGGTRFIGAAVTRHLAEAGHTVAIFHRGQTEGGLPDNVERILGDARHLNNSRDALTRFAPDAVLHNIVLQEKDIADTLDVFKGVARRLIMTSSMDVYRMYGRIQGTEPGERLPLPADEDAPLRENLYPYRASFPDEAHPMHHYDKIPAERLALHNPHMAGTVLRLPMVIGEGDYQNRLLPYVVPMVDQRPSLILSDGYAAWQSTYGYVENVAAAMSLAVTDERAAGRIYNVADGAYSSLEMAQMVAEGLRWRGEIVQIPDEMLPESMRFGVPDPHPLVCSSERIQRELGFTPPIPFEEGMRRTAQWDAAHLPQELPSDMRNYEEQDTLLATRRSAQ